MKWVVKTKTGALQAIKKAKKGDVILWTEKHLTMIELRQIDLIVNMEKQHKKKMSTKKEAEK